MPCDCCSTDPCTCEDPRVVALRARVAELERYINGAIEATTSAIESQRKGDVDGWELHLILGRLNGAPYNAVHSKRNLL